MFDKFPFLLKAKDLIIEHKIISGVVALVMVVVVWQLAGGESSSGESIFTVTPQTITSEVAVTGRVKPVQEVSMAFEKTGRISGVRKKVGDRVYQGELIANLDLSSSIAKLSEEQSKLEQLQRGSRPEEIAVKEANAQQAKADLQTVYDAAFDTLNDAFVKSEDAVRIKLSGLFSGSSAVGYNLTFNNCDTQTGENAKSSYAKSEAALSKWRDELSSISGKTDEATRELALRNGLNYLTIFRGLLRDMSSLLNQQCALSNTSLSDYRDDVSTANTSIATALTNVSTKLSSINTYKAALRKAESDLALLKAGSDPEEVDAQRARVLDAQAAVRTYEIIAPFGGVVSKQDAKLGEIAYANTELVSVIGDGAYEIEINVPELDITYIKAGNSAHVTFDAYGENVSFDGAVTSVDPAETIVDNVPTYKVKVSFTTKDERIKSGLTANVYIQTATKEGVLTVPSKAITSENGKKIVSVKMPDGSEEKREVVLGIRGNHGEVEVLSGLKEGDNVVIRNASAQK